MRPLARRQIAPWRTREQDPVDPAESPPAVYPRDAAELILEHRPDDAPFAIGEFMAHDSKRMFGSLNHTYTNVLKSPFVLPESAAKQTWHHICGSSHFDP
jgi:hypothetical protein